MKRTILFTLSSLLLAGGLAQAEIKLPNLIGDNMVLQQETQARLWGEALPNTEVKISCSWSTTGYTTTTDANGDWEIQIQTPSASFEPRSIRIENGKDKVVLNDLLIGEVWFCSGQSNMEMPLRGFWHCPIEDGNHTIATAGQYRNRLRYATIAREAALTPRKYPSGGEWKTCTPLEAPDFGATAYYFATLLTDVLQVPVGIINCSWGGSTVEGWLPEEILKGYPDVKLSDANNDQITEYLRPMIMYNGLLKPSSKYTIKGFLWYQGESNVGRPDYAKRLATMVDHWRSLWGEGELPFYLVEIAPYEYGGDKGALLREQQAIAAHLIPNSGIISTNDLVEPYERKQIHPKDKRTVGYRLAYMALNKSYGFHTIACESPEYERMEIKGNEITLYLKHVEEGFNRDNGIQGFEIAGQDKQFHPAEARIDGNKKTVIVSSPQVAKPTAVRYGFRDFLIGNLYNTQGLPLLPFRTDRE